MFFLVLFLLSKFSGVNSTHQQDSLSNIHTLYRYSLAFFFEIFTQCFQGNDQLNEVKDSSSLGGHVGSNTCKWYQQRSKATHTTNNEQRHKPTDKL
eukprot:5327572-Amphidinium_carterae.1